MCGIAGLVDLKGCLGESESALIRQMTMVIAHRGPDDDGFYVDDHAALGFRRLAIIDLKGGHQPLSNEDGTVWIVFNGEIYNYPELRDWLIGKGHRFQTRSDTETIVHLYEEVGTACAEKLRGMFAFAIWDSRRRELYLARDRTGKKPLYYSFDGERFWFASEIKSILQDPRVNVEVDLQALDAYLTFFYVPAPMTGFKHISKLPGGHWLRVSANGVEKREYWDWNFETDRHAYTRTGGREETEYLRELREQLEDAVRVRLMSEVPLGAFLSGGVDSSVVVGLMAQMLDEPVRTTSIGFDYERYSELRYAREIANRFGTNHVEHMVEANAIDVLERIVWHLDEPFGDPSVLPTFYLSQITRQSVTVALSGDGGDEVFAGYDFRYLPTQREVQLRKLFPDWLRRTLFTRLAAVYPRMSGLPRPLRLKTILKNLSVPAEMAHAWDLTFIAPDIRKSLYRHEFQESLNGYCPEELVLDMFRKTSATHWLDRALYVDAKFYMQNDVLTKVDRMSMANSLEVRSPFLDQNVMAFMATIPADLKLKGSRCKHILKEAMKDHLPPTTVDRPKQGFSIPLNEWLRNGIRDYAADRLLSRSSFMGEYLEPVSIRRLWDAHQKGENFGTELWTLLMLELWGSSYLPSVRLESDIVLMESDVSRQPV